MRLKEHSSLCSVVLQCARQYRQKNGTFIYFLCYVNQQNEQFLKINVLIQFFLSSTCFEHLLYSSGRPFVHAIFM